MITKKEKLLFAMWQVDNIIKLTEDNEYKSYIFQHLNPVYYELQRQLNNLNASEHS